MSEVELQKRDFAQTLARGMSCLEALTNGPATVAAAAKEMGVHRASARRILLTLQNLGYVREEHGRFSSTPKILSLGRGVIGHGSLWATVAPEVEELANRFNEPSSISILEGLEIMFVARDSTRRIYNSRLGVGDRLPAHCSASGKVLLAALAPSALEERLKPGALKPQGPNAITDPIRLKAALAQIRQDNFGLAVDEMEAGTISIAVPLRERSGAVIAAMSVASHRTRRTPEDLKQDVLPELKHAAARIESTIQDFQDRHWVIV